MSTLQARPTKGETVPDERMGLSQSTALIVGSIIGVGIFSLPYALASYGPISLVAMAVASVGTIAFALRFAALTRVPAFESVAKGSDS